MFDPLWSAARRSAPIPDRPSLGIAKSVPILFALIVGLAGGAGTPAWASPQSTITSLAVTSAGSTITTVPAQTVVTLTATVSAAGTAVTPGQVNFCDASAAYCTDIHLIGVAQLTSGGTATVKFIPGIGSHSYKAIFVGTHTYAASSSTKSTLAVTGTSPSVTTVAQSGSAGNYTLTATVSGLPDVAGAGFPTGTVSFLDTSANNTVIGAVTLGPGTAGLNFSNSSNINVSQEANVAVAADFNGDGIPDLAVSDSNSGQKLLAVLLGNGDGTFTPVPTSPTVGLYPDSIAVGDFNSDGLADLAVTSVDQNLVTILLGNGDGTFTATAPNLNTFTTPQSVATGDFNGDGIVDLAVVANNVVIIYLGNGDGSFVQLPVTSGVGNGPINVAVGDFNSDGIQDLAVTLSNDGTFNPAGSVAILLGKGDGTFSATSPNLAAGGSPDGLGVADLNGDGILDLAISDYGNSSSTAVMIFLGNGDGTFKAAAPYAAAPGLNFHSIAIQDFNRDGIPDIAVGEFWHSGLSVLLGKGDGSFGTGLVLNNPSQLGSGYLAVADFNGDGIPDMALPSQDGTVPILLTQLTQTATAAVSGISVGAPSPHQVEAGYLGDADYSASVSGTTALLAQVATPVITPAPGTYTSIQTITISDATPGASIYYAGSGPLQTPNYVPYTGPITLTMGGNETIRAYASATGYQQSELATASYLLSLPVAATPVISLASGTYTGAQSVTISESTPGTTIYYTTNGISPTTSSSVYTGPITISMSQSLKAIAAGSGYTQSSLASAFYSIRDTPSVTWTTPAAISYGTPLSTAQLNASSTVAGTFAYTPAAGTVLPAGSQTLSVTFTPTDLTTYTPVTTTAILTVNKSPLTVSAANVTRAYGAANPVLAGTVTGSVNGDTFTVTASTTATTTSPAGSYPITYTVTGSNVANYTVTQATGTLTVTVAMPTITWPTPATITYGTALSSAQLNATATTTGTFTYTPAAGVVPPAGTQTLSVTFTPADTTNFSTAPAATVSLGVNKAPLAITANNTGRVFGAPNPAFIGTVSGAVNGDTFTENFSTVATAASPVGGYPIVPSVVGVNLVDYTVTPSNGVLTISQAGTATTVALSNSNLALTATVLSLTGGTPTGPVDFYLGQTLVGTRTLVNGVASLTVGTSPASNVIVSAQYNGDTNFTQSTSPSVPVLAITPAQNSLTVARSGSVSDALTLAAASGFTGTLQLSCSGLPQDATCSFQPASVTFSSPAGNSASTTLTVRTGVSASAVVPSLLQSGKLITMAGIFWLPAVLLCRFAPRKWKLQPGSRMLLLTLLLGGLCCSVTACGSSPASASETPAGTSILHVLATGSSGFSQTVDVTLTVQ